VLPELPITGLSVQVRDRFDDRHGNQEVSFTLMHGFAPGNKPMMERIVRPGNSPGNPYATP
jgi:hypothetical protein